MRCPVCKTVFQESAALPASLPFCSVRCKQIDLGRWLDERNPLSVEKRPGIDDMEIEDDGRD